MQQEKSIDCDSPQYEHRKCKEYNHLQIARFINKKDDATLSTEMQSVHRTQITIGCQ
jgi:hypothetical protein